MEKPIINIDELEFTEFGKGDAFQASRAAVSPLIGASKLGYAVIKLAPGKRAWPYHSHRVIEEAFFVLDGAGTLRHADEEYPIKSGDFIASPADPNQPHQIVNTSDADLTYIAISTMDKADVFHYPDSGKFGVFQSPDGTPAHKDAFVLFGRQEMAVNYWDGETDES